MVIIRLPWMAYTRPALTNVISRVGATANSVSDKTLQTMSIK